MTTKHFFYSNWKSFLKYAIVGVSGTIIDIGGFNLLISGIALLNTNLLTRSLTKSLTFLAAVLNNFIWNKTWTFRDHQASVKTQFLKFFFVSLGGFFLNLFFFNVFSFILSSLLKVATDELTPLMSTGAALGASATVLTYNFLMNRYWTFKPEQPALNDKPIV